MSFPKIIPFILAFFLLFGGATTGQTSLQAETLNSVQSPFLWVIETNPPSFLYGTIHLPDERVVAIPDSVMEAFKLSDVIYTEIPFDSSTQMAMMMALVEPSGKSLQERLDEETWELFKSVLESRNVNPTAFDGFKVWAANMQVIMLDILPQMMAGAEVLDMRLITLAVEHNKETGALETVQDQLSVFENFTDQEHAMMLRQTLEEMIKADKEGESPLEKLIQAYLTGDKSVLWEIANDSFDPENEIMVRFMELLMDKRDVQMAKKIDKVLTEDGNRSHFFAAGALHFSSDTAIQQLLREKGYTIVRVESLTNLPLEKAP